MGVSLASILLLILAVTAVSAFQPASFFVTSGSAPFSRHVVLHMGMNRKARRQQQRTKTKNRQKEFYDAVQEADKTSDKDPSSPVGTLAKESQERTAFEEELAGERVSSELGGEGESVVSGASVADAVPTANERPDVSEVVMDEDTGILRVVQGENVKDIVTGKAVQLSNLGPEYRMAQMFPDVSPETREKYRLDWKTASLPQIVDDLSNALAVEGREGKRIPPHPQISDTGVDFVLANRDYLGYRMSRCLGRLKLRAQSQFKKEEALSLRRLWKKFLTIENHISAPFRQIVLDAEKKIGPNFGNLDVKSYCSGEVHERTASYLVLKGMVAHWEKKVKDAEYVESTPETNANFLEILMVGDPRRYLPDPPIIYRLNECLSVCLMARNMTQVFVSENDLYDDLPCEVRFIEDALRIKSGTELRRFIVEEFCPREQVTPERLREGVRRLYQQMHNLQVDPYGDLTNVIGRLVEAMSVGTEDEIDPYISYLANMGQTYEENPGFFQTYTFDHDKLSLVSFLDYPMTELEEGKIQSGDLAKQLGRDIQKLGMNLVESSVQKEEDLSAQMVRDDTGPYKVPENRAAGRPHNLGWLQILGDEEMTGGEEGGQ
mmetsp:Transcript_8125/g.17584  ORF Transcript_8125/g.17584 Transcript_8125/m.17584 type:complete len:606 (-) Transcript_8125:143-1960(-)